MNTKDDVITEVQAYQMYDDMLDDVYGNFMEQYPASRVLKAVDEIAYNVGFQDFVDGLETDEATKVEGWND